MFLKNAVLTRMMSKALFLCFKEYFGMSSASEGWFWKFRHRPESGQENKSKQLEKHQGSSKADTNSNQLLFPLTAGVQEMILASSL